MTESLVQPPLRDQRHYAYELVYREQLKEIDLKPCLHYRIHLADGTPVAPALIHLGRQFSVMGSDGWNLVTTDDQKRLLIQEAILLHRTKGTAGGVEAALARAGFASARVAERLGAASLGPSNHDGRFYRQGDIRHDGGACAAERGWALFGVTLDAGDLDRARRSFGDVRALIDSYKRACCHLVWLRPGQRLSDDVRPPQERARVTARPRLRDRLLKGPFHDGSQNRGGCARPRHDGAGQRSGVWRYDGRPVVARQAAIRYGRALFSEALTIHLHRPLFERLVARAHHDGSSAYRGAIRHDATRPIPCERRSPGDDFTISQGRFGDPIPAAVVNGGSFSHPALDRIFGGRF